MFTFFLMILVPNLFRQFAYYTAYKRRKSIGFITSPETRKIFGAKKLVFGVLEEIGIGALYTFFWHYVPLLGFLVYGWLCDAVQDVFITAFWMKMGRTPYQLVFGEDMKKGFLLREVLVPYAFFGLLLFFLNVDVTVFAIMVFLFQGVFFGLIKRL